MSVYLSTFTWFLFHLVFETNKLRQTIEIVISDKLILQDFSEMSFIEGWGCLMLIIPAYSTGLTGCNGILEA